MTAPLQSVLHPAGPDAAIITEFAWVLFAGGAVIFAAVMALAVLALRRSTRPVSTTWWIAGAGIAFPATVLTVLLGWSTWRAAALSPQTSLQPLQISVTAKMWWWEVRYRDAATGREIVSANEIHIPAGQTAYVGISSSDVIHSLWVPALNGKIDAIPGRMTGLTLHAARPGVYRGQCAEFCGEQHARMALHVVAHAPADYARWLAQQAAPAAAPASALLQRGRDAFTAQRCGACHTIRGVAEGATLGPDLTHVGSRMHIAAGTLRTHRGTLAGWIADPQSIKPGVRMPAAAGLDGDTLLALATYLESLK
ncbi:c-type cytochrome [Massilia sp. PAMC28688]|uniref:cytochrome c oxidase subunit II n=1 Tax=Massilia sp. PAMC28688 TaxID=2861283 RepID=UPI001C62611D|nr:c-type cytochrome [Massilia sp. PAMC28688]QYF95792.1 c-type cytochrome [Massilia sp. PAMC28688]